MPPEVRVIGVEGMPELGPGDDLSGLMMAAAAAQGTPVEEGDILVVTQKVISKVEGKVMSFENIEPSQLAITITEGHRRDPRHTEAILREADVTVALAPGNRMRVSPAAYNDEADIDVLIEALNG